MTFDILNLLVHRSVSVGVIQDLYYKKTSLKEVFVICYMICVMCYVLTTYFTPILVIINLTKA